MMCFHLHESSGLKGHPLEEINLSVAIYYLLGDKKGTWLERQLQGFYDFLYLFFFKVRQMYKCGIMGQSQNFNDILSLMKPILLKDSSAVL